MTLKEQEKLAHNIMRLLKVRYVSFPIALTEKGQMYIKYVKDTDRYQIVLDAVPLDMSEYDNKELKSVLEKYLFEDEFAKEDTTPTFVLHNANGMLEASVEELTVPKKIGRPSKSK